MKDDESEMRYTQQNANDILAEQNELDRCGKRPRECS